MDIYRNILREVYRTYRGNRELRRFFVTVLKNNGKNFMLSNQLNDQFQVAAFSILKEVQALTKSDSIQKQAKKDLDYSYIVHRCIEGGRNSQKEYQQRQNFAMFSSIQFYYLIYHKKIFPKKIIARKEVWADILNNLDGKVKWNFQGKTVTFQVPLPRQTLSALF